MRVKMIRMREKGVELARRMLMDRYTVKHWGSLVINDVKEPTLRRIVKVARLTLDTGDRVLELIEPQLLWVTDQNFVLHGFERLAADGEYVDYAQAWLCTVELEEVADGAGQRDDKRAGRR